MCKLCEQEGAKEPVSYSTSATSKLRTHVEKAHIATATAISASEPQEPPEKKIKLTTENIFSVMLDQQEADATVQMYHPRRGKAPGFVVVQFGTVPLAYRNLPDSFAESLLCSAQRLQRFQMLPAQDIMPNNYLVQRDMVHATKGTRMTVQFRTLVDANLLVTFQIKLLHQTWDDLEVQSSDCMKTAVSSFLSLHQVTGDVANAPAFSGYLVQPFSMSYTNVSIQAALAALMSVSTSSRL